MHHFSDVEIFPSFKFLEAVRSKAFLMSEDIAKFPSFELYHFNLHQQCMSVCLPIQCVIKRFDLGQTERWNCETLIIFLLLWIMGHLFLGVINSVHLVHLASVLLICFILMCGNSLCNREVNSVSGAANTFSSFSFDFMDVGFRCTEVLC